MGARDFNANYIACISDISLEEGESQAKLVEIFQRLLEKQIQIFNMSLAWRKNFLVVFLHIF